MGAQACGCWKGCPPVSQPLPFLRKLQDITARGRVWAWRHNSAGESVGLESDRPAFCGRDSNFPTNWQGDLGHVPLPRSLSLSFFRAPPASLSQLPATWLVAQGYSLVFATRAPCLPPQCAVSAKAGFPPCLCSGRSNSESNGPAEQVHPSCWKHYCINKAKRTQTQVHCPKGGNNTSKWPECLPTQ